MPLGRPWGGERVSGVRWEIEWEMRWQDKVENRIMQKLEKCPKFKYL